jgi:hypothetical protein
VADPRKLDEEILALFQAQLGGVRTANEQAALGHLARRFESGPELSQRLWGAGREQREPIFDY